MPHVFGRAAARLVPGAVFGWLLVLAAGCGSGGQKLVKVKGKVYVGDKLAKTGEYATGNVVFHPDTSKGNTTQELVKASIEPDGSYKLFTRDKEGAPPGWYTVTVDLADTDPKDPYKFKMQVAEKYMYHDKSGLSIEVVENPEPGRYDLKLTPR